MLDSGSKRVLIVGGCQIINNGFDIHDKVKVVFFSKGCTPFSFSLRQTVTQKYDIYWVMSRIMNG